MTRGPGSARTFLPSAREGQPNHEDQRGTSLLECAFALALAAVVVASTTKASQASATLVRRARAVAETVDVARNLLEHELGAPCAAPLACPSGYRCSVTRAPVTAIADRLTASVSRSDGEASEELRTLAPAPSCGG